MPVVGQKFDIAIKFYVIDCYKCHGEFAVSNDFNRHNLDTGDTFWCPYCGAPQHYTKSNLQRERERADSLARRLEISQESARSARQETMRVERQRRALKGQMTKLKKRIGAGVCPCCNRNFQNISRHIKHMHPEFLEGEK